MDGSNSVWSASIIASTPSGAGAATILLALRRFLQARRQIDRGDYRAGVAALLVLGLLSVGAAVSLAVYIGLSGSSA